MLSININKLRGEVEEREKRKNKLYEKVLDICYQRIINNNQKSDNYSCTYIVPNVVFGLPLYDVNECTKFIMNKLVEKGFDIKFAFPSTLHISWIPEEKRVDTYNSYSSYTGSQYKAIEPPSYHSKYREIKPQKSILQPIPSNPNRYKNSIKEENIQHIQYKSIDDYIDSKPLIYDPDDINVFQNKLNNIFT
jgi:hypothetical protein